MVPLGGVFRAGALGVTRVARIARAAGLTVRTGAGLGSGSTTFASDEIAAFVTELAAAPTGDVSVKLEAAVKAAPATDLVADRIKGRDGDIVEAAIATEGVVGALANTEPPRVPINPPFLVMSAIATRTPASATVYIIGRAKLA